MKKNLNKKAGNWGALYNKPQNQVYFKDGGKVKVTAGGEKHVIYKKTTKRGEGKVGNIMVNHPTKDKGVWDTIDLTKKAGAKTVQQGVAATKKWHKENPYNNMKKQLTKKQMGGPSQKTKTVNKNGSYRTVEKTKSTPSSFKQSSKTTRTGYGILKGAPKYKNILPAPVTPTEPSSDSKYMQKGGMIANARKNSLTNRLNKATNKMNAAKDKWNKTEDFISERYATYGDYVPAVKQDTFTSGKNARQNARVNKLGTGDEQNKLTDRIVNKQKTAMYKAEKRADKLGTKLNKVNSKMKTGGLIKKKK